MLLMVLLPSGLVELGSVKRQMKTLVILSKAKNLTQKTLRYAQGDSTI